MTQSQHGNAKGKRYQCYQFDYDEANQLTKETRGKLHHRSKPAIGMALSVSPMSLNTCYLCLQAYTLCWAQEKPHGEEHLR